MPTYTVSIYNNDPLFILSTTISGSGNWTGEATPSGTATITDTEAGIQGLTLDSNVAGGETATADVTVGGSTSTGASIYAEESWTLSDSVTGDIFNVITFRVDAGPATGYYTLSEIPLVNGRSYQTIDYNTDPDVTAGDPAFNIDDYQAPGLNVEGTSGDDTIDAAYVDAEGDSIGTGDDQISAGDGNDSVQGSDGDDTVFGGGGSDTLNGGNGADVIYGDNNGTPADSAEILDWSAVGADESDISAGFTQNTGEMDVSVSFTDTGNNNTTFTVESTDTQYVDTGAGETFDTTSSVAVFGNGDADTGQVAIDFAAVPGSAYADEVENVAFRINDIDSFAGNHTDIVSVTAFDAAGNPVTVVLTAAGDDTIVGDTITAGAALDNAADANGSVLVEIAGPVSQVIIDYSNGQGGTHGINITNVHFDAVATTGGSDLIDGGAGDDNLFGEIGDDTITGGTGNDTLTGGDGNDSLTGGTGADQFFGGLGDDEMYLAEGDSADGGDGDDLFVLGDLGEAGSSTITIIGGETGETNGDTLQLTPDVTQADITFTNTDDAAGGLSGNFTMADGTIVTFSEIENIICFTPGALILTPRGERPVETLHAGDLVITRDHGPQPIRWIGRSTVEGRGSFAPIAVNSTVMDGARRPLLVSPQHRLLFTGYKAQLLFGECEVLVAAKHLVDGRDVHIVEREKVTYFHMMLDRHEVIYAEGAATESFHAGDFGISAISDQSREEVFTIFPELRSNTGAYGDTARICLKQHEARLLAKPNRQPLLAA